MDTGVFDDNRYFDVFVEYAKADVEDILIQITVANRGPETRAFVCYRLCGFATLGHGEGDAQARAMFQSQRARNSVSHLERRTAAGLHCDGSPDLLFTENETNAQKLFSTNGTLFLQERWHQRLRRVGDQRGGESRAQGDQGLSPLPTNNCSQRDRSGAPSPD